MSVKKYIHASSSPFLKEAKQDLYFFAQQCSAGAHQIRDTSGGPCMRARGQLKEDTMNNVGSWKMLGQAAQGSKAH